MNSNRVDTTLSPTDRDEILNSINSIREKLPFLLALTPEEARSLPRLGDKSRAFVAKAVELADRHPQILPGAFELEALKNDLDLFESLYPVLSALGELYNLVNDTTAVAGSEAFTAARMIYTYAKMGGQSAELEPLIQDLSKRYRRKPAAKAEASDP